MLSWHISGHRQNKQPNRSQCHLPHGLINDDKMDTGSLGVESAVVDSLLSQSEKGHEKCTHLGMLR